jgi:23S rRNA (uracil1939-C5)-methyltransferase
VTVTLGGLAVPLPEGAFLQATPDGEAALVAAVVEGVGKAKNAADLFAGLGTFTFATDGNVHAVEGAQALVLALQSSANRARRSVTSEHRDLFRRPLTSAELARFDAVIFDPPRAGAPDQVAQIAASAVPTVVAVSCNPATFARDAKILGAGGYQLDWIQPVGQFRWSTHVELAARFSR